MKRLVSNICASTVICFLLPLSSFAGAATNQMPRSIYADVTPAVDRLLKAERTPVTETLLNLFKQYFRKVDGPLGYPAWITFRETKSTSFDYGRATTTISNDFLLGTALSDAGVRLRFTINAAEAQLPADFLNGGQGIPSLTARFFFESTRTFDPTNGAWAPWQSSMSFNAFPKRRGLLESMGKLGEELMFGKERFERLRDYPPVDALKVELVNSRGKWVVRGEPQLFPEPAKSSRTFRPVVVNPMLCVRQCRLPNFEDAREISRFEEEAAKGSGVVLITNAIVRFRRHFHQLVNGFICETDATSDNGGTSVRYVQARQVQAHLRFSKPFPGQDLRASILFEASTFRTFQSPSSWRKLRDAQRHGLTSQDFVPEIGWSTWAAATQQVVWKCEVKLVGGAWQFADDAGPIDFLQADFPKARGLSMGGVVPWRLSAEKLRVLLDNKDPEYIPPPEAITLALDEKNGSIAHRLSGIWSGSLSRNPPLTFQVTEESNIITGVLDFPQSKAFGIPISRGVRYRTAIRLEMKSISAVFAGTIDSDGVLVGQWTRGFDSSRLYLHRASSNE